MARPARYEANRRGAGPYKGTDKTGDPLPHRHEHHGRWSRAHEGTEKSGPPGCRKHAGPRRWIKAPRRIAKPGNGHDHGWRQDAEEAMSASTWEWATFTVELLSRYAYQLSGQIRLCRQRLINTAGKLVEIRILRAHDDAGVLIGRFVQSN